VLSEGFVGACKAFFLFSLSADLSGLGDELLLKAGADKWLEADTCTGSLPEKLFSGVSQ